MCTAYEIGQKGNRLPAQVKMSVSNQLRALGEMRIVRPTLVAPVIMPDGDIRQMSWGFRRQFRGAKGSVKRTIVNSREDKLAGTMWREAFRERRCLIPAAAFYEWVEGSDGKSMPLRFSRPDEQWLVIAGIWEEGESGECFSMITTEPSDFVRKAHDRMPAVLSDEQIDPFLNGVLNDFGSSEVVLAQVAAENFLKPQKPPPTEGGQGILF